MAVIPVAIGIRAGEFSDRYDVGDDASEPVSRQPGVQVEGRRLNLERFRPAGIEFKGGSLFAGRTSGGRHTCKHCLHGAMNVTGRDKQATRIPVQEESQCVRVSKSNCVGVKDAGLEGWMVQKQQCGSCCRRRQRWPSHDRVGASSSPNESPGTVESMSSTSISPMRRVAFNALSAAR